MLCYKYILYVITAQKQGNLELKKKLAFETLEYATKAIECDDSNAECHKWFVFQHYYT